MHETVDQEELVRVLAQLNLDQIPSDWVLQVFDTGGSFEPSANDAKSTWAPDIPTLVKASRAMAHWSEQDAEENTNTKFDSDSDISEEGDENLNKDTQQLDGFWKIISSSEVRETICGDPRAPVHRNLLTMLCWLMGLRGNGSKPAAKALLAATIYLTWIRLKGCAAYGIFMPFVYRQAIHVLHHWGEQSLSPQRRKKSSDNEQEEPESSDEDLSQRSKRGSKQRKIKGSEKIDQYALQLLRAVELYISSNSLKSTHESIVATIDTTVFILNMGEIMNTGHSENIRRKCRRILVSLLDKKHGSTLKTVQFIYRRLLTVICMKESISFDSKVFGSRNKLAIKCHREAVACVIEIHAEVINSDQANDNEGAEDVALALLQHICLQAPERADARQHVVNAVEQLLLTPTYSTESLRFRFTAFLLQLAGQPKALYRILAVQFSSAFLKEKSLCLLHAKNDEDSAFGRFLSILFGRSKDKISSVRAKAINGLSSILMYGLRPQSEDEFAHDFGRMLRLHFEQSESLDDMMEDGNNDTIERITLQKLLLLFRERLSDEKTIVRRAAVQALEVIMLLNASSDKVSTIDVDALHRRTTDASVMVRNQAVSTLTSLLLHFPDHPQLQRLWNQGVLPLAMDPELSVQARALDAVDRVIIQRVLDWQASQGHIGSEKVLVWCQVADLHGIMVRSLQKSIRQLIRASKLDVGQFIAACEQAIQCSYAEAKTETANGHSLRISYWSFAWIVLEELAFSGELLKAAKEEDAEILFILKCWNDINIDRQLDDLSASFASGAQRILRILSVLAPVIQAEEASSIADGLVSALTSFVVPINLIAPCVSALYELCCAKAPSREIANQIASTWGNTLMTSCEQKLTEFVIKESNESESLLQRYIFTVGEVALIDFDQDDDKTKKGYRVALLDIPTRTTSAVQSLLAEKISNTHSASSVQGYRRIPEALRATAFVTLGKLCLRDQALAKDSINMFIRELRTSTSAAIRSNVALTLGDLCIRYTSLVDLYIPTLASSFLDSSPLVRKHTLMLLSQLILQDYVKWRGELLCYYLMLLVDEDPSIRELADYVLATPLLRKSPHLFTNKFVDVVFWLNKNKLRKLDDQLDTTDEIPQAKSLTGAANASKRRQIYCFLLNHMQDEQKLQVSMKLVCDVLGEVIDGNLPLAASPSSISDTGTEAVLKDTLMILYLPELKINSPKTDRDAVDEVDAVDLLDQSEVSASQTKRATQVAAAKGKLLAKISKKNFLENVVPIVVSLKNFLENNHSPVMRYLMRYLTNLFKDDPKEIKEILAADPRMAQEIQYDIKRYEQEHEQRQRAASASITDTPSSNQAVYNEWTYMTPMRGSMRHGTPRSKMRFRTPLSGRKIDQRQIPQSAPKLKKTPENSISRKLRTPQIAVKDAMISSIQRNLNSEASPNLQVPRAPQPNPLDERDEDEANVTHMLFSPATLVASRTKHWEVALEPTTSGAKQKALEDRMEALDFNSDTEKENSKLEATDAVVDTSEDEDSPTRKKKKSSLDGRKRRIVPKPSTRSSKRVK